MSEGKGDKPFVITKEAADKLYDYLAFRHFFVHGYSFMLSWDNLSVLVYNAEGVWKDARRQVEAFVKRLRD